MFLDLYGSGWTAAYSLPAPEPARYNSCPKDVAAA